MEFDKRDSQAPLVTPQNEAVVPRESAVENEAAFAEPIKKPNNRMKAIVFINLSTLLATLHQIIYKSINLYGVGVMEFVVLKICVHFTCNGVQLLYEKRSPFAKKETKEKYKWLFWRAFFGQTYFAMIMYGITLLPLSLFMVLWQTSPFFTSVFGLLISKERIYAVEWIAMVVCFCGVVLVCLSSNTQDVDVEETQSTDALIWGVFVALATAALYSMANISSR